MFQPTPTAFTRKVGGYAPLDDRERALLDAASRDARVVRAGYDLIREGDKPGPVFAVLSGWACRYKMMPDGGRQITAFLLPGDFCDLHAGVLEQMDHAIGTLTECRVATIPRATMEGLITATPALTHAFWRA